MNSGTWAYFFIAVLLVQGCRQQARFALLSPSETGVKFANHIVEDDSLFNPIVFDYIYNGGGVAIADVNNDLLPDLFFTGNRVSNRLYLNRGDFRFEDITDAAGLETSDTWSSGVVMGDVNADGLLDIYVTVGGNAPDSSRRNLLYMHQGLTDEGVPRFVECASSHGVADDRSSTQAAFLDYDRDGDLDLYVLNNAIEKFNKNQYRPKRINGESESTDRLYRNNGDDTFTDVSREAGILIEGYGLGLAISDLNRDGWPDVYAANDFLSNDLLYINNRDGTFTNEAAHLLRTQTHNGMGVDIADYSNDGLQDIVVLDMLPPDNYRRKMMLPGRHRLQDRQAEQFGYEPQFVRNTLQLHSGFSGDDAPHFVEVGRLANIEATDWSWAPLLADLDNDGWNDLIVTNGYRRDVTNLDFIEASRRIAMMGTPDANRKRLFAMLDTVPEVQLHDYAFQNNGDYTFSDQSEPWGFIHPSYANGAAYGDLDLDGDLDLVFNTLNESAHIYQNRSNPAENGSLRIALSGPANNPMGIGARVTVFTGDRIMLREQYPSRGYLSMVEPVLHFGTGSASAIDSLEVVWPDGTVDWLYDVPTRQVVSLSYPDRPPERRMVSPFQPDTGNALPQKTNNEALQSLNSSGPSRPLPYPALRLPYTVQEHGERKTRFITRPADYDDDGDMDELIVEHERGPEGAYYATLTLRKSLTADGQPDRYQNAPEGVLPFSEVRTILTDVLWSDFNQDGKLDLLATGLWMAPLVWRQEAGRFVDVSDASGLTSYSGLWKRIIECDPDNDGDRDYVAGNWGLNSSLRASHDFPLQLYVSDFDRNGTPDPILVHFIDKEPFVFHPKAEIGLQIPGMIRRFPTYHAYAQVTLNETFSVSELQGAHRFDAQTLASSYFENKGDGTFAVHDLPALAQIGEIIDLSLSDIDQDSYPDLIIWSTPSETQTTLKTVLTGNGNGWY